MSVMPGAVPSLDAILKAQAARNPSAIFLIDAPDCERVTGLAPRRLSYLQADRAVDAIAARLREIGLPPGTVVGIQLPNITIGILTLLAVMRAGMVPAPLPLLWRRNECVSALSAAGARAIIICGRVADWDHAALALEIAAELFPIRAVCGFGCDADDGIVPLDDCLNDTDEHPDAILFATEDRPRDALVTFDLTVEGIVPMGRACEQLLAGGRLIRQRAGIADRAVILSTLPATSYAGLSAALVPGLLSAATLVLHHPADPELMRNQIVQERCDTIVVPDAILAVLGGSDWLDTGLIRNVIAVWRAPERFASAAQWTNLDVTLVDAVAFGETAMLAARRPPGGRTAPWPDGPIAIAEGGPACAHVASTQTGTLAVRGLFAASPYDPFAAAADRKADGAGGHIDTGYPCRRTAENALVVTAPPKGMVCVGGYRFAINDLQHITRSIDGSGVLAALPHTLTGHRLAGHASKAASIRDIFQTMGMNPLLTEAFGQRGA